MQPPVPERVKTPHDSAPPESGGLAEQALSVEAPQRAKHTQRTSRLTP